MIGMIDSKKVISLIDGMTNTSDEERKENITEVEDAVKDLVANSPEALDNLEPEKIGCWVRVSSVLSEPRGGGVHRYDYYNCSNCGQRRGFRAKEKLFSYCPECGARMVKI